MKDFKRILVPTDLSKFSSVAFEYAKFLARTFDADLFVLHVVEESPVVAADVMALSLPVASEEITKQAEADLKLFVQNEVGVIPRLHIELRYGNPFTEICRFADELAIGLIVVATHGRTGIAHALLGSTAERIVQHAHVPVLAVKPEEVKSNRPSRHALEDAVRR
jgi:nucleotide-binding universal stress UspA family protein